MTDNNQQVEIRQADITYIEAPYNDAMKQADVWLQDTRYSLAHKTEQIGAIITGAVAEIRRRGAYTVETLSKELTDLQGTARLSVVPSSEQAAQLSYARDALQARWSVMDAPAMYRDWEAALSAGDKITARLYADFAAPVIARKLGVQAQVAGGLALSRVNDLAAKTEDSLLTAGQKKARAELRRVEATIERAKLTASGRAVRLEQARIINGKLIDGATAAAAEHLRSRF